MCIYCLITCKGIVQIYNIRGNGFFLLEHLVAIYVSPRVVVLLWCIMYGMYVHIKAVTYVTFPNKPDFLPMLIKRNCQTRIYS